MVYVGQGNIIIFSKEIASFSELDSFFSLFIKNKVCIDLLFKILS